MFFLCICNFVDLVLGAIEFHKKQPFLIYLLPSSVQAQIRASAETYVNLFLGQGMRNGLYRAASTFNVSLSWGEMAAIGFVREMHRDLLLADESLPSLLARMAAYRPPRPIAQMQAHEL